MAKIKGVSFERIAPALVFVSILLAFGIGVLWQKVSLLENGVVRTGGSPTIAPSANDQPARPTTGKLTADQAAKVVKVSDEDHVRGSMDADVYLIEYSDYQCPYCARFHPTVLQVMDEYGDKVAWVYRHFPLDQIHPQARSAAEASECIAEIGGEDAFWDFTDALMSDTTKVQDLGSVYEEIGLNSADVEDCVDSGKYSDVVDQVYKGGINAGISGTPGNIIMNKKGEAWLIPGALPLEQVKATIDEALQS